MAKKSSERTLKEINAALKLFPKIVKQKEKAHRERERVLKNFAPLAHKLLRLTQEKTPPTPHPWRMCPQGQHWVSSHPLHVPVSDRNPAGVTQREGHCRINPSKKDQLYTDEMLAIADKHFVQVKTLPSPIKLGKGDSHRFDSLIGGWTQYWNEVLKPETPLDPNIIKALIATESEFRSDAKSLASKGNWARGLMQITDETLVILKDEKGELKDFLVNFNQSDAYDPNLNICAGIRWLFHKKSLLQKRRKTAVTWEDAVMEYKAFTKGLKSGNKTAVRERKKFLSLYERLKK